MRKYLLSVNKYLATHCIVLLEGTNFFMTFLFYPENNVLKRIINQISYTWEHLSNNCKLKRGNQSSKTTTKLSQKPGSMPNCKFSVPKKIFYQETWRMKVCLALFNLKINMVKQCCRLMSIYHQFLIISGHWIKSRPH